MQYLCLTMDCNGSQLTFGHNPKTGWGDFAITSIEGIEASDLEITTSENALVDGSDVEGKRILKRPIHIEAVLMDLTDLAADRQRIIKFFNPKYTGTLYIDSSGTERKIDYELSGWKFDSRKDVVQRLAVSLDLMCPIPYMQDTDDFGKNMADVTPQFAFPWMVVNSKVSGTPDPYKGLTLTGQITGYKTVGAYTSLTNTGDVPCGIQVQFIASRGSVSGPRLINNDTGEYIHVNLEMEKDDVLLIDTSDRNQIIELNGENVYNKIDRLSNPFKLEVGANHLSYDADENYSNLDVLLYFTPLYLGV